MSGSFADRQIPRPLMPFYLCGGTGTCRDASVGLKAFVFKLLNCVEHIVIWGAWLGRHTC